MSDNSLLGIVSYRWGCQPMAIATLPQPPTPVSNHIGRLPCTIKTCNKHENTTCKQPILLVHFVQHHSVPNLEDMLNLNTDIDAIWLNLFYGLRWNIFFSFSQLLHRKKDYDFHTIIPSYILRISDYCKFWHYEGENCLMCHQGFWNESLWNCAFLVHFQWKFHSMKADQANILG